uniref:Uncharacterized protein n=1 Tax=Rhizophora mucronata TaxID=61149 RepID=A0A2P2JQU7_RHIMU
MEPLTLFCSALRWWK